MKQLEHLLPRVIATALCAGKAIMEIYSNPTIDVTIKGDDSPLTQADLAADKVINGYLTGFNLNWPILSEESASVPYEERKNWTRYWLVDPLDGTKEFINRNGEFTVNIALIENGVPIMGVVYSPVLDVCYFALKGFGASIWHDASKGFIPTPEWQQSNFNISAEVPTGPVKVVASRSHCCDRTKAILAKLGDHELINMGSSLKICMVAEGKAHLYPRLGPTMEWDTAAAHAIVLEAGGTVCDRISGRELQYNKPDLHNPEFYVMSAEWAPSMFRTLDAGVPYKI